MVDSGDMNENVQWRLAQVAQAIMVFLVNKAGKGFRTTGVNNDREPFIKQSMKELQVIYKTLFPVRIYATDKQSIKFPHFTFTKTNS